MTPEQEARQRIDARFAAAVWVAQSGSAHADAWRALQQVDCLAAETRPIGFCSPISITPFVSVRAVADVGHAA